MEQLLKLYGLDGPPFDESALDPDMISSHDALYADVEGFGQQRHRITDWFNEPANANRANRVLVYGPEGCGRTSVARYIGHTFAGALDGTPPYRVEVNIGNDNEREPVQNALNQLYRSLKKAGDKFVGSQWKGLAERYESDVVRADEPANERIYRGIFEDTVPLLGKNAAVVLIDNARTYPQVVFAIETFVAARLIVITTAVDSVATSVKAELAKDLYGFSVDLRALTLADISDFLALRWTKLTGQKHPFPQKGLNDVFFDRTWSFRAVTGMLRGLFDAHLKDLSNRKPPPETPTEVDAASMAPAAIRWMQARGYISVPGANL